MVKVTSRFSTGTSSGTGFFINANGDVVTANHVVHPPGSNGEPEEITIKMRLPTMRGNFAMLASFTGSRAHVKATDAQHDIVVLGIIGRNPFTNPISVLHYNDKDLFLRVAAATVSEPLPKDGEPIFISGYPLDFPTLITNAGIIASSDPIEFEEKFQKTQVHDILWGDIAANHGNSGGPVLSTVSGYVVGIQVGVSLTPVQYMDGNKEDADGCQVVDASHMNVRPIGYNAHIANIVPAKYVLELLRANIPFNVPK
jgi:S1-C subfamily serine protease